MDRKIGILLAVSAAVLLTFGAHSRSWWSSDSALEAQRTTIGLRSAHMCLGTRCSAVRLESLVTADTHWLRLADTTYAAGLLAIGLLLAGAILRLRYRQGTRVIPAAATVGSVVAIGCALLSIRAFPGIEGVGVAYGMALYIGGAVLGVVGSVILVGRSPEAETS